ncbi:hypothetical protein J3F83DRAFT_421398 [Trichoderma novae-zelandiae]
MPPFEAPSPSHCEEHLSKWQRHVTPEMQSPDLLFGEYWRRFNTIRVPILGQHRYLNYAIEIAKLSKNKTDFERIFEARNKQLEKEMLKLMSKAANQTIYNNVFPCQDASDKVFVASVTGAFTDFAALLQGLAFGWEADRADEGLSDYFYHQSSSCDGHRPQPEHARQIAEESQREHDFATSAQQAADAAAGSTHRDTAEQHKQQSIQSMSEQERRVRFSETDDACLNHQEPISNATANKAATKERSIRNNNVLKGPSTLHQTSANPSRKRPRCIDDDDDNSHDGRVHQRRKLERPSMVGTTSVSDHDTSRRRPRCDDVYDCKCDNDNAYHRQENQKPEMSVTYTPLPVKRKSTSKNDTGRGLSSRNGQRVSQRLERSRSPRLMHTRSTRREGHPTLWELDHSGKARRL